ncbi:hypothetical protein KKC00_00850 [Patescibacteria group bacterium]|nr:hypothetical protein [Patescibacteria group bacterium]
MPDSFFHITALQTAPLTASIAEKNARFASLPSFAERINLTIADDYHASFSFPRGFKKYYRK